MRDHTVSGGRSAADLVARMLACQHDRDPDPSSARESLECA